MAKIKSASQAVKAVCTLAAFMCISSLAQASQYTQTARLVN